MSNANNNPGFQKVKIEVPEVENGIVTACEQVKRKREPSTSSISSLFNYSSEDSTVAVQPRVTNKKSNSYGPGKKFLRSIAIQTEEDENKLIEEYIEKVLIEERQLRFQLSYDFEDSRTKNRIHADAISQILDHVTDGLQQANEWFRKEAHDDSNSVQQSKQTAQQTKMSVSSLASILEVCKKTIVHVKSIDVPLAEQKSSSFSKNCKAKIKCFHDPVKKECIPAAISKELGFEFKSAFHECPKAYSRIGKRIANNKRVPIYQADAKVFIARKNRFSSSAAHLPTHKFLKKESLIEISIPENNEENSTCSSSSKIQPFTDEMLKTFQENMKNRDFDPSTFNISSFENESAKENEAE